MTGWLKLKLMGLITFINAAIGVTLGAVSYTHLTLPTNSRV